MHPRELPLITPSAEQHWNPSATAATWVSGDGLWLYDAERGTRRVVAMGRTMGRPRFTADGDAVHFESGSALYRYDIGDGALTVLASRMASACSSWLMSACWILISDIARSLKKMKAEHKILSNRWHPN